MWNEDELDEDINMDSYTYVFFKRQLPQNPSEALDLAFVNTNVGTLGKVIIIEPENSAEPFALGTLHFFRLGSPGIKGATNTFKLHNLLTTGHSTSAYLGKASIYGAIFSENKVLYECTMNKAMQRLQILTLLQYYRIQEVVPYASTNCAYLLNNPLTGAATKISDINKTAAQPFSVTTTADLRTYLDELDKSNKQLATLGNCPAIY